MAGIAHGWQTSAVETLIGVFMEAGWGRYKSHNGFEGLAPVNAQGNTAYTGGGIMARVDAASGPLRGLYAHAAARAGQLNYDYGTSDLRDPQTGQSASYDYTGAYYGLQGGLGYLWRMGNAALDIYSTLFWTHEDGHSVRILGDPFTFDPADSYRVRSGMRLSYAINESFEPYIGAGWEHEFSSKARATADGMAIPAPSLRGDTGVGEVGMLWRPGGGAFSLDFTVQGFTGQREGVMGHMMLKYEF